MIDFKNRNISKFKKQSLDKRNLLFIDCEWANSKNRSICQLALIYKEKGNEIKKYNFYINPNDGFDDYCISVHNITKSYVDNCDTFDVIWKKIEYFFTNSIIIGHNVAGADLNAIAKNIQRYNLVMPELYYIDTYEISRTVINPYSIDSYKLNDLCEFFDIAFTKQHDSLSDVSSTYKLFNKLHDEYGFNLNDFVKKYNPEKHSFVPYIYSNEFKREICQLYGVVNGISIDNEIGKEETNYIMSWRQSHKDYICIEEIKNIIAFIDNILDDGILTRQEVTSLKVVLSNYLIKLSSSKETVLTLELQGIINGIESDGIITKTEVLGLQKWMYENDYLRNHYPYDILLDEIESILEDGVITSKELSSLHKVFNSIIDPISNLNSCVINFTNNSFCLSGDFSYGSKKSVEDFITSKSGTIDKNVKKTTSYLVLGEKGSQQYANGNYGLKFTKAKNYGVSIIKEKQLFQINT